MLLRLYSFLFDLKIWVKYELWDSVKHWWLGPIGYARHNGECPWCGAYRYGDGPTPGCSGDCAKWRKELAV